LARTLVSAITRGEGPSRWPASGRVQGRSCFQGRSGGSRAHPHSTPRIHSCPFQTTARIPPLQGYPGTVRVPPSRPPGHPPSDRTAPTSCPGVG
jgi:hypothetical protein